MYRIGGFAVAAMGLIVLVQSASAQSNCKDLKGDLTETTPDGTN